ncbi:MAG: primosomal protein [Pseudonocardiales bacterium]|nr:primosomal protein [Pseudonocardiales bacterium]MBV9032750.1 primosomal protein [Pseudonocardiales bacterium]MBW0010221.1 primosomal protein [Pseudonocardiales bacterium]
MAADIVPIELSVTAGDLVTLWAPRWREDTEEWEAFLGDDENLFAFADVAALVGFVRTARDHDLIDHPAWALVPRLPAPDLRPTESHRYDLVGVPELVTRPPDTWVIGELADVVSIVRSLAEVCGLEVVHDVLDSTAGFSMLDGGTLAFGGREGARHWDALCTVIARRWDEVIDAVDGVLRVPDVDAAALEAAASELSEAQSTLEAQSTIEAQSTLEERSDPGEQEADSVAAADPVLAFWSEIGIDPIRIISDLGEHYTLRCYLDDAPVFLGRDGRIDVFGSPRSLVRHLADNPEGHDLDAVSTWPRVTNRAQSRELEVALDDGNSYVLSGLADDLAGGPETVDPGQLELAVELIADAERWAGSDAADKALASSEPLGWLVSFLLRPDPTRLAPSAPFAAEVAAWRVLVGGFEDRLHVHRGYG